MKQKVLICRVKILKINVNLNVILPKVSNAYSAYVMNINFFN